MPIQLRLLLLLIVFALRSNAQTGNPASIFETIVAEVKEYKPDTSAVPDDKTTRKIIELRSLKGGFNIDEAIRYKIAEEKTKGDVPAERIDKLSNYFTNGDGHRLLTNAITWLYRHEFSYKELKQLVRFYRTGAGQKLAARFPLIMLKSLAAVETIKALLKE